MDSRIFFHGECPQVLQDDCVLARVGAFTSVLDEELVSSTLTPGGTMVDQPNQTLIVVLAQTARPNFLAPVVVWLVVRRFSPICGRCMNSGAAGPDL
jgi:hypothetical protein